MRIVQTRRYLKDMKRLGASAVEIARLEETIAANPTVGDVIPGLGGLRKLRFAPRGRGKRAGGRAIYFLIVADDLAVMVFAYAKSEKQDLTADEKKMALALMKEIQNEQG
jgi:hypothetical protein